MLVAVLSDVAVTTRARLADAQPGADALGHVVAVHLEPLEGLLRARRHQVRPGVRLVATAQRLHLHVLSLCALTGAEGGHVLSLWTRLLCSHCGIGSGVRGRDPPSAHLEEMQLTVLASIGRASCGLPSLDGKALQLPLQSRGLREPHGSTAKNQ